MQIPSSDKKIVQANNSDLFGNLHYSKSLNLDEEGYIKVSSRAISLINEETDSNFDLPVSFGRRGNGDWYILTTDKPYTTSLSETSITVSQDTDSDDQAPIQGSVDSLGRWWQNKWHVTGLTGSTVGLMYKTPATGNWSNPAIAALSSGSMHALEVFRSRNSLCISDGVTVNQYSQGYSTTDPLTSSAYAKLSIPNGYEMTHLAFSGTKMGVATRLSDDVAGQNEEAFFFTWDGLLSTPNQAVPVGSDTVVALKAYKSSWIIITRNGEIKFFNGGGFTTLTSLPFWYSNKIWGTSTSRLNLGDMIEVDGDVIYFNLQSKLADFGVRSEEYMYNNVGGILCYDPKIGIYHKYAPSISQASMLVVSDANVNTTTNTMTKSTGTIPATGNPVKYVPGAATVIGGLKPNNVYYIIKVDASNFKVATTKTLALAGTAIDLTTQGNTLNYFLALDVVDYGISKTSTTAGVASVDTTNPVYDHLMFGGDYYDVNSTTAYAHLNITVSGFKNIGYFVTSKETADLTNTNPKVYIKYRPLNTDETITIKYKDEDVLGLPVTTPQASSAACTWASSTSFTTTSDLSAVKTYLDASTDHQCEVEIISGAGAGQMSQISTITELNGTYTVTISDALDGAVLNNVCDVLIDNWKYVGQVTSSDDRGLKEFPIGSKSTWMKYKVILTGSDITIEEFKTKPVEFKKA